MAKRITAQLLPDFDLADQLRTETDIADYLTLVLAENHPDELIHALGVIARARGMSDLARSSGLTREGLYKALRSSAQPRFDTIQKVCRALGIKLVAQPIENSSSRTNIGKSARRAYSVRTARSKRSHSADSKSTKRISLR